MSKKNPTKWDTYEKTRISLCNYKLSKDEGAKMLPVLERLAAKHGSKVAAITAALKFLDDNTDST